MTPYITRNKEYEWDTHYPVLDLNTNVVLAERNFSPRICRSTKVYSVFHIPLIIEIFLQGKDRIQNQSDMTGHPVVK